MKYIERNIKDKFRNVSDSYSALALVGPRQAGKTTFLKKQMGKNDSYVLFDDPDAREMFEQDVKKFKKQYIKDNKNNVLDEVHYCEDAGRKIKYLVDIGNKVWITSSSEIILSKDVLSYLVGRVSIIRLYPFSLPEFLRAKGYKEVTNKIANREIDEHIKYGGYPKVVLTDDYEMKKTILRDLYELMTLKDIIKNFSIGDSENFEKLTKYLSLHNGDSISYENISNNIDLTYKTIRKYISAMEKGYLITRVEPFYTNKIKEITKRPKIHFLDIGLRNIISNDFEISGNKFENYVLTEMIKSGYSPKYWKTKSKAEVDFIVEGEKKVPVEVKLKNPKNVDKSLVSFIKRYNSEEAYVVYKSGHEKDIEVEGCEVKFRNIYKFSKILNNKKI